MVIKMMSVLVILLVATELTSARTWIVAKDGSGDFTEVQDAVDAASDGDIVLVRPGTFGPFDIRDKSVTIVGSGIGVTILENPFPSGIRIVGLPDGSQIGVGHVTLSAPASLYFWSQNGGALVMSSVELDRNEGVHGLGGPAITANGYLAGSRLEVTTHDYFFDNGASGASFYGGVACLSEPYFEGLKGGDGGINGRGEPGGDGVTVSDTELYFAGVSGKGGEGAAATVFGVYCDQMWPAERGGHGLFLEENSLAFVAARPSMPMFFEGGRGGTGYADECGNPVFPGAPGGDGIHAEEGSMVLLSGPLDARAGRGGLGDPPGPRGEERVGEVIDLPVQEWAPILGIEGEGSIGSLLTFDLETEANRQVLLVFSDRFGRIHLRRASGFPLFAVPGGNLFFVTSVGRTAGDGTLQVSVEIPDDFALVGSQLLVQAIVLPENISERARPSNVVCEVFRDKE